MPNGTSRGGHPIGRNGVAQSVAQGLASRGAGLAISLANARGSQGTADAASQATGKVDDSVSFRV